MSYPVQVCALLLALLAYSGQWVSARQLSEEGARSWAARAFPAISTSGPGSNPSLAALSQERRDGAVLPLASEVM